MKRGLIAALLQPINTSAVILLGIYTIVWGLWMVAPWSVFPDAGLYDQMRALAPEQVWGTIAIICGSFTAYGAYRPSYKTLTIGAGMAFSHWFIISILYFMGNWRNTGGITAATFALYAAYVYLNIRVNKLDGGP